MLVLNRHKAIARHDGDALAAARNTEGALCHPPADAPVHHDGVEVLGPLLAAHGLHVQELGEVLVHVLDLNDAEELHDVGGGGLRGREPLRVEVERLPGHGERRLLANLHLLHSFGPDRRGLRITKREHQRALLLLWVGLLLVDDLYPQVCQLPLGRLALQELRCPSLVAGRQDLLLLHVASGKDRPDHVLLRLLRLRGLLLLDDRLLRGFGPLRCLGWRQGLVLRCPFAGLGNDHGAIGDVVGLSSKRLDVVEFAAVASQANLLGRHPDAVLQVLLQVARRRVRLNWDIHFARWQHHLQLHSAAGGEEKSA
mmetsp:Transcript_70355/g.209736  ORF Transcript_70355/g.209736 Transcript_70355/m.209736 type:complete len:312 (+) Transcript_70355:1120-2055(+)